MFAVVSSLHEDSGLVALISQDAPLKICPEATSSTIFGWSDFPCQGENLMDELSILSETPSSLSVPRPSFTLERPRRNQLSSLPSPPVSPRSSIVDDLSYLARKTAKVRKVRHNRTVSFSPVVQVRTHETILGDHPCCVGGMALACGWQYNESRQALCDISKRSMVELHLKYSERRDRLQETTGLAPSELLQQEYELVCEKPLHHTPTFQHLDDL